MKKSFIRKIYSDNLINKLETKIKMSGKNMNAMNFQNLRVVTTIIMFFLALYGTNLGYVFGPLAAIIWYFLYDYLFLEISIKKRGEKLNREALDFFEILTLTLESGRNLENSLEIAVSNVDSELSNELKKALVEVKLGRSLMEALENMKERIPSETINNIILNITQTDVFGNSILDTMYNQIEFLRDKEILEIKGQINKIPNKISIISVLFILPLILLIILGPYLIKFIG
ncbi:MAG: type II secretion system F family protein [Erysipelotrichaceae bacterium]|nr:type II secretion system F family protein [Erysipelotrichaceae bacterium]